MPLNIKTKKLLNAILDVASVYAPSFLFSIFLFTVASSVKSKIFELPPGQSEIKAILYIGLVIAISLLFVCIQLGSINQDIRLKIESKK